MFYGLSNYLKKILPKQLFYRSLIIVAAPIIVMQITISIVFFDSLWIKTNKGMTRALVNEIATFIDAYEGENNEKEKIIKLFESHLQFSITYETEKEFPDIFNERWFSPIDRSLRRELKSQNFNYWFSTSEYKNLIDLRLKYKDGFFQFFIPRERLTTSSVRLFVLWITLPAVLVIFIAILFLKNQTRPITKLAEASERFGRGEDVEEYRPSGALEIRKAGLEFDRMRKRILRHLDQRSEMLSGISHDLRTPLTRLKLQLALLKQQDLAKKMSDDIEEMERMLNEYLEFSRHQKSEETEIISLNHLIEEIITKYDGKNIKVNLEENLKINIRVNAIKRCLINLIDNGLSYGKKVEIFVKKTVNNVLIFVDDDGPGIPEKEYQNVMKPFYRIDKSRGQNKSGVGLGLSIANDIIRSHGGNISLEKSSLSGLRVKISLPL